MYDSRSTALEPPAAADKKDPKLIEIWGEGVIGKRGDRGRGFVAIPAVLQNHMRLLDLDVTDFGILAAIWRRRWGAGEIPFPSKARIGEDAGIRSERTVTRHLKRLDAMGYLTVHLYASPDKRTHGYTTEGLERLLQLIAFHLNENGKLTDAGRNEVQLEQMTLQRSPFASHNPKPVEVPPF